MRRRLSISFLHTWVATSTMNSCTNFLAAVIATILHQYTCVRALCEQLCSGFCRFAQMIMGETNQAAKSFEMQLKYNPNHLKANYYLGMQYYAQVLSCSWLHSMIDLSCNAMQCCRARKRRLLLSLKERLLWTRHTSSLHTIYPSSGRSRINEQKPRSCFKR